MGLCSIERISNPSEGVSSRTKYISCLFLKQSVCNRFRAETEGKKGTVKLNNEHVSKRLRQRRYDPIVWNTNVSEKKRSKKSVVKEKRNR